MTRFRRWLIHKLGGICMNELPQPPKIIVSNSDIKTLQSQQIIPLRDAQFIEDKYIYNELSYKLSEEIEKYSKQEKQENNGFCVYTETIRIVTKDF